MEKEISAAIDAASAGKPEQAPGETGKPAQAPATPEQTVAQTKGQVASPTTPTEEPKDEWNGDVNKLPPELQSWAKKAQRELTKKAMAESELRRKGQEYLELINSDDWKKFQESKNKTASSTQDAAPVSEASGITPEEWEAAQLDSTGQIANQLIQREIARKIDAAAQHYGMAVNSLEQKAQVTEFKTTLSEFTDLHPDVQELYEDGIIEPLLNEELRSGKHNSYEEAIQSAYDRGTKIKVAAEARALAKSQGRVAEKKDAVTTTGISTGDISSVEVPKSDVFQKAFEAAIQGKKVNVKSKR